jgi:hypothetical protein
VACGQRVAASAGASKERVKPLGVACAELAQWGRPWCCYRAPFDNGVRGGAPHKNLNPSLSKRGSGSQENARIKHASCIFWACGAQQAESIRRDPVAGCLLPTCPTAPRNGETPKLAPSEHTRKRVPAAIPRTWAGWICLLEIKYTRQLKSGERGLP